MAVLMLDSGKALSPPAVIAGNRKRDSENERLRG